ncbi:hypothetical protein MN116_000709 [Schistosoma mekongi]|uniref:Enhancer of mRNA-decapping protein 4 WD40 repeat region domain-containing protein n=1 Tax=Schistosoma mekongi TaxID=38744 RepID=A0AAE1ZI06_SCHME|nr:hypothetical protein MN116_000709 [Schistosoma mekongi]
MNVQDINFTGSDEENIKDVFSSRVSVYPSDKSALDHGDVSASSKISIQPAVKYFWDYQYYVTRLISRHYASSLIAYAIKHVKKTDSDEDAHLGMVRLLNTATGKKLLLRSFADRITYIDFALRSEAFLAILDHSGTVGVFKIDQGLSSDDPMVSSLLFSLRPPEDFVALEICSLAWCPWVRVSKSALLSTNDNNNNVFVPPRDPSLLLAYSAQHKVKVINVGLVVELLQNHFSQDSESEVSGSWSEKQLTDAIEGWATESLCYAELSDHSDAVTVIALSRDASCLASASLDGKVYLYSLVNRTFSGTMNELRQIHMFSPHNGLPLYSLIFLDNVLHNDESITWSHLLTGAQHNREIRLWSCSDWSCLQVIQFCSAPTPSVDLLKPINNSLSKSSLILSVDHSASFLIATDVTRRVLYTFELASVNDPIISSAEVLSSSPSSSSILPVSKKMCFISIGEFLLTTPCLLFALGPFSRKTKNNIGSLSVKGKNGPHNVLTDQICLDIHIIHNRNLLNGTIRFDLPHRSELSKLKLITTILQQSFIESSNHHQPTNPIPTTIDNSSNNDDPIKSIPSSSSSLNSITDQQVEFNESLDEHNSAETLSMKQVDHYNYLRSNTLEDQRMVLDAEMRNVSDSDCQSSNYTKEYNFNNHSDTIIISPIKYEPPEAKRLQNALSMAFLNMNNQLPENFDELLLKNTDTSLENRLITDSSSMKPLCNATTDDDNCNTSQTEISTTTTHQHDKVGIGDYDDNNREVGFEDDSPDSVDKFLSGQVLLNTSGPAHGDHSNNHEIDTTNYINKDDLKELPPPPTTTTTSITPPLLQLSLPPELSFTKPTITEEDPLRPTSSITNTTPTIPEEAYLQETSLNVISSALTTDKYVVDDKDTDSEIDTVVNPTAKEQDIHDGDINDDDDDDCRNYQSFEDLKFVLKEDVERNSAMLKSNDDNICVNHYNHSIYNNVDRSINSTTTNTNEMNMILNHLEMLALSSREQSRQFGCILDQLNETKSKLERLEQSQFDIIELINNINYRTSVVQSPPWSNSVTTKECNIVNSEQSEIKSIELANQIILQLRTVQGDFSRRYAQISDNMKKILSNVQESSCQPLNKVNALHNLESRISLLPKLTTDSIRVILHEELLRIFSSNVSRIIEPLQHSLCSVINGHLSTLPATVNDNVQRVLREKNFTSQIVRSASGILSTELSGAYRDSLNKIFIPALEKSVKKLFSDLNNLFQTGTQQYLNQIPSRIQIPFDSANFTTSLIHDISSLIKSTILETLKEVEIPGKTIETTMNSSGSERINPAKVNRTPDLCPITSRRNDNSAEVVVCDKMSNTTSNLTKLDKTATAHKSYNRYLNKTGSGGSVISTTLVSNSGSCTNSNISNQKTKTQTTNEAPRNLIASTSFPPPPTTTVTSSSAKPDELTRLFGQAQVLIRSNRLVDALELALVSTNQPLLLDVCGDIDVNQLFSSGDYKIGQNILLSLIHQLSCSDLTIQLDLKIKYLQEAILCLEFDDPTTTIHGPAILHLVNVRLDALLDSNKIANSLRCRVVKLNRSVKCLLNQNSKDK